MSRRSVSSRFTRLETAVVDALAWELGDIAPDLAGQFAESLPGQRRNTGSGMLTEMIVGRSRPAPLTTPTGRFGTVHAMVGDLPDPIAFQVQLRAGRLLYLFGDSYGQDTRHIDFATVRFDQVFTIDEDGASIAFDPAARMPPSPLPAPRQVDEPSVALDKPLTNAGALQRLQDRPPDAALSPLAALFGLSGISRDAGDNPASAWSPSSRLKTWAVIAAALMFATLIFRLPPGFLMIFAVYSVVTLFRRPELMREVGGLIAHALRPR